MQYNKKEKCYNVDDMSNLDNIISSFNELPLTLTVEKLAEILGICKANAYILCHQDNFPAIKVGKRYIIPLPAFREWMANPKGG